MLKAWLLVTLGILGNTFVVERAIGQPCNDRNPPSDRLIQSTLEEELNRFHSVDIRFRGARVSLLEWQRSCGRRYTPGDLERFPDINKPLYDVIVIYTLNGQQVQRPFTCYTNYVEQQFGCDALGHPGF
jgi:hypothetical protein